jgi:hypothetical protein
VLLHVLHALWTDGHLALWAERPTAPEEALGPTPPPSPPPLLSPPSPPTDGELSGGAPLPWAAPADEVRRILEVAGVPAGDLQAGQVRIVLPTLHGVPVPSPRLVHAVGRSADDEGPGWAWPGEEQAPVVPSVYRVPVLRVPPERVLEVLEALDIDDDDATLSAASVEVAGSSGEGRGPGVEYFAVAGRFVRWLLGQHRFVPSIVQDAGGGVRAVWQPWLADEIVLSRLVPLARAMPPAARSAVDAFEHRGWPILEDFLLRVADAQCRAALRAERLSEAIEGRAPADDPQVLWLSGLLDSSSAIEASGERRAELLKTVRRWIGQLDQRAGDAGWRLCLVLQEPVDLTGLTDLQAPGPGLRWPLTLHLQNVDSPQDLLDASDIWVLPGDHAVVGTRRVDKPAEVLLSELGRAARLYRPLEEALARGEPDRLELTTTQAYEFLREHRSILIEQGFGVIVPEWWDSPAARLGVRLRIDPGPAPGAAVTGSSASAAAPARAGLASLVHYSWQISIGQVTLSLQEFEKLAQARSPLVMIGGRWVEVRPEDVQAAVEFIRANPGGQMELGRALRLAYAADVRTTGLPVVGLEAGGWLAGMLRAVGAAGAGESGGAEQAGLEIVEPPARFVGSLRPYQVKGLSWLTFLDRVGLGACLADDMGLGKTIQLLALLLREREEAERAGAGGTVGVGGAERPGPTLLVVPMSVVGNWVREAQRFAPSLRLYVHHGPDRRRGEALLRAALEADLVITTYALANRDRDDLEPVPWGRIALDEAQNIKNPAAKQTQAIRSLEAPRRVALTGTPIENRLSELWSIMDFLNPGLMGPLGEFRAKFAVPIERYHDAARARRLRGMVQPFVLRRLKTDPSVIADLPEKLETRDFCYLTPEQASLYEATVRRMLASAEQSEGIQRRGVILAGLVKLKQICNHPHLYLRDLDDQPPGPGGVVAASRSGKCVRLIEMLDEVIAGGGQALVFTQFRQMGALLAPMLRTELDREVLFLHGGTTAQQRDAMVARFQKGDGSAPVFILSLKAGGIGLNLTAANHVFHFDRWWNPAVESQATDRAYRIGQTRTVQVHKFVVSGTLEERIDQMIEQKSDLAANVIGSGEAWLTELSLAQLRDVLTLRPAALEDDDTATPRTAGAGRAAALAAMAEGRTPEPDDLDSDGVPALPGDADADGGEP